MKKTFTALLLSACLILSACSSVETSESTSSQNSTASEIQTDESTNIQTQVSTDSTVYTGPIVTTGQSETYDENGNIIDTANGFYGQDADYEKLDFAFTLNDDGTTYDENTGLTWISIPDSGKMTWEQAVEYCENLTFAGYDDWRLPTAEELFSISDFETGWPYLDTENFGFDTSGSSANGAPQGGGPQGGQQESGEANGSSNASTNIETPPSTSSDGSISKEEGQYWCSDYNLVEGDERLGNIAFGVNHLTGHIKAYPASSQQMGKYVRAVRGDVYGSEDYTDNGDGTITDNSSGLMWLEVDLGVAVNWQEALELAENSDFAGYDDWRLPDVKELQSIVSYDGSYPAINQNYFTCTELTENENYYYWSSTSAYFSEMAPEYDSAWYVAFGYTSHGAGAVRFSPKYVGSDAISEGEDNILNSVRLVRTIS